MKIKCRFDTDITEQKVEFINHHNAVHSSLSTHCIGIHFISGHFIDEVAHRASLVSGSKLVMEAVEVVGETTPCLNQDRRDGPSQEHTPFLDLDLIPVVPISTAPPR